MFTQCPACKTVFNVRPEQINTAHGKVRCSRCHGIFNAKEHLYTPPGKSGSAAEQKTVAQKPAAKTRPRTKQQAASPRSGATQQTGAGSATRKPAPAAQKSSEEKPASTDWFDLTPTQAAETQKPDDTKTAQKKPAAGRSSSIEDELNDDLFKLFDEPEEAAATTPPAKDEIGVDDLARTADTPRTTAEERVTIKQDEEEPSSATESASEQEHPSAKEYSLPPQLETHPAGATMKTVFYLLGSLIMVAGLAIQYAYSYRIPLQENETLRPWLDTLCQVTNCPMPPRRDPDKIELLDNMMQSHPRYRDSLLVTATLVNRADYVQPYPVVEITMSDLQQKVVARRTFRPQEYLVGESAEMNFAPNIEVALMLEIEDPGENAVGFKFDFY